MFKFSIQNGERQTINTNPQNRGGKPVVSSSTIPCLIVSVVKEFDEEHDNEDFDEIKIISMYIEVNGHRFYCVKGVNTDSIEKRITYEKIEEDYKEKTNLVLIKPYYVIFVVVDNFNQETCSRVFRVS